MLFTKDLLFIHVPKTGGMSVTNYLRDVLPTPVYYVQPSHEDGAPPDGVISVPGSRHQSLEQARRFVAQRGFDITRFPLILAVIRNPYELEVSRYAYLQTGHPWDRGYNQELAMTEDFEVFAAKSTYHGGSSMPLESYFLLDGRIPKNLFIVRHENLAKGVKEALRRLGIAMPTGLPWLNRSIHGEFTSYYSKAAEEAVYQKYKWVFDQGLYERINLGSTPNQRSSHVHSLPLVGPVRQVGPATGFWPDSWIGNQLAFRVRATQAIDQVSLGGRLPPEMVTTGTLILTVNGQRTEKLLGSPGPFTWTTRCTILAGEMAQVEFKTSVTWCPKLRRNSADERELSFLLEWIRFDQAVNIDE
jgi:hypothetical protein